MSHSEPSQNFLEKLNDLTDRNCHTEWYIEVTKWCIANCHDDCDYPTADEFNKDMFELYLKGFTDILNEQTAAGHLSLANYEKRNWIADELEKLIKKEFKARTHKAFFEAA